jgi:hypothetical protein
MWLLVMDHVMSLGAGESQKYLVVRDFGGNNLENGQWQN